MVVLKKIVAIICCVVLLSGCYEDESEVTLNPDGSGSIKQKLVLSERLIVGTSEDGGGKNTPPLSKESVLEKVASAIDISSITMTELPDGGRLLEFKGTFNTPEQFFLSDFCRDTLKLRLAPVGNGKAAIYCDAGQSDANTGGPSTTQLYGLAKGLYIKRTIHLPVEIENSNGRCDNDKKTVSWVTNLRDQEGLERTRAFIEGPDKGVGSAVFDASGLGFSLPLKSIALEEIINTGKPQSTQEPSGLKAEVSWIAVSKKVTLHNNRNETAISDLTFGINIFWDNNAPFACHTPVLTNIQDDLGNDLVKNSFQNVFKVVDLETEKKLEIEAKTPANNAAKVRHIEGYVPVVTNVNKQKIVLEDIQELVGKESTSNSVLDELHFKIKSIEGSSLTIEIDGGHNTITSLEVFKKEGDKVKRRGGSGWGDNYSYDFADDISKLDRCELEVIASKTITKVPFSLEEALLP